ncbi:zinc-binding dehydrogenase [Aureobasidium sp. EXF-8845]|nr:zinc-binding dehydrogenase [Aureobasidium sp. EXF-8845]KAI4850290.1 zinc-binding dehydrogenase [Aureobasidium sp. EXF-8846]
MPANRAAYLVAQGKPLEVREAPYTTPGPNQVVVKNAAVAINPVDWLLPKVVKMFCPQVKLPFIFGDDCAGTVVEVGEGVKGLKVGDRVLGLAVSFDKRSNKASEGGFQEYTVLRTTLVSKIPDWMSFESASVIPLGLATAACGLFLDDFLGLQLPTAPEPQKPTGKTVIIWGGSTSVGCNAIQLAVAAGYEVISTASPRNHEYLKRLGATEVFDYNSPSVVEDIISTMNSKNRISAGAYAIGVGSLNACIDIVSKIKGKKFVAQASHDIPMKEFPTNMASLMWSMGSSFVGWKLRGLTKGVAYKFVWATEVMANKLGSEIYEKFLPIALAERTFVAAPEPQVAGKGLEGIEDAFAVAKKGVSAKKIVVSL